MTPVFVLSLSDIVGLIVFGLFMFVWAAILLNTKVTQSMCKHDVGVNETMACNAICRKCGKNLGFIGTWREKQNET